MTDSLNEWERKFLLPLVERTIVQQEARVFLETEELDRLYALRDAVEKGFVPDEVVKTRAGMVSLDLINLTRGARGNHQAKS